MSISEIANANRHRWIYANPGAEDDDILALVDAAPLQLPADYIELLRAIDGGEAEVSSTESSEESFLVLWRAVEVVECNTDYELPVNAPSFFAFGSNGGGELYAFDIRRNDDAVFWIPAIGMSNDSAILFTSSFRQFIGIVAAE